MRETDGTLLPEESFWQGFAWQVMRFRQGDVAAVLRDKDAGACGELSDAVILGAAQRMLMLTGASMKRRVRTLDYSAAFTAERAGRELVLTAEACHSGRATMVIDVKVYNASKALVASVLATMSAIDGGGE